MLKNKQKKLLMKNFYMCSPPLDTKNWFAINFIPSINYSIIAKFKKMNINIISYNKLNLGKLLINNKTKTDIDKKSGIYKTFCDTCSASYIGQSGRNFKVRLAEHAKAIKNGKASSGLAEHCINNNHKFNPVNFKMLHNCPKGLAMNILENLEIKKALFHNENITNEILDLGNSPLLTAVII